MAFGRQESGSSRNYKRTTDWVFGSRPVQSLRRLYIPGHWTRWLTES